MTELIDNSKDLNFCLCGCRQITTFYRGKYRKYISGHNSNGSNHPMWKGGKRKDVHGYIWIWKPDHPFARKGYVREHRLVYELFYNCILLPWIVIHHINGIKDDNRIENLLPMYNDQHTILEHTNKKYKKRRLFIECTSENA